MAGRAYIGTSGWSYGSWKNRFYEGLPQSRWLEYCAARFTGLEVNGTFYRLQAERTFLQWIERTPDDFVFTAKGHRFATHRKKLLTPEETIATSRDNMRPFEEKLAAIVWQMPANFSVNLERLEAFADALVTLWPSVRHAFEFRDTSWFSEAVAAILRSRRLAVCQSDAATWPMWDAVTTDLVYIRLHGHTRTYASRYSGPSLAAWAEKTRRWMAEGRDVHVYFDNDAEGAAPYDALRLMRLVGIEKPTG